MNRNAIRQGVLEPSKKSRTVNAWKREVVRFLFGAIAGLAISSWLPFLAHHEVYLFLAGVAIFYVGWRISLFIIGYADLDEYLDANKSSAIFDEDIVSIAAITYTFGIGAGIFLHSLWTPVTGGFFGEL